MEKKAEHKFILVREDVLPEAMIKTLQAKELLERGQAVSVGDATKKAGLSRSAFYKYRDTVFPFHSVVKEKIVTLFFYLEDRSGTLSEILRIIASYSCNILTIHQTIPIQGRANVTVSLNVSGINRSLNDLLEELQAFEFVNKVEILGSGA